MTMLLLILLLTLASCPATPLPLPYLPHSERWETPFTDPATPQQIRLSLTGVENQFVVSWVSLERFTSTLESVVHFGFSATALHGVDYGSPDLFNVSATSSIARVLHNVVFDVDVLGTPALPAVVYYRVQSVGAAVSSPLLHFRLPEFQFRPNRPLRFTIFGDFATHAGVVNSSLPELVRQTETNSHDVAILLGDQAYNLDTNDGRNGDDFLNDVQAFAAATPFMTAIGCHERDADDTYRTYLYRYRNLEAVAAASKSPSIRYYSFNWRGVHFVTVDTDAWIYYDRYPNTHDLAGPQYEWLKQDLGRVNREKTPWIVMFAHRTMYCTKGPGDFITTECNEESAILRDGIFGHLYPLEKLLAEYHVDLYVSGHTHHYERTWPVRNNETVQKNYINPAATVHILTGIAGVPGTDPFTTKSVDWSAFRDLSFTRGIGRAVVHNSSHLEWQQVAHDGSIVDSFWIVQMHHTGTGSGGDDRNVGHSGEVAVIVTALVIGAIIAIGYRFYKRHTDRVQLDDGPLLRAVSIDSSERDSKIH